MFEQFTILDWLVEVDKEATAEAYRKLPITGPDTCICLSCKNFGEAVKLLPSEFVQLCADLGVDPAKTAEVYDMGPVPEDTSKYIYGGWYHLVGRVLRGPSVDHASGLPPTIELCDGFGVSFTERVALVPEGFPAPVLQLEFFTEIAWLLDEDPYPDLAR